MMIGTRTNLILAATALFTVGLAAPANGQDSPAGDGGDDTETKTLLAYLGLTAAAGENTVGEGAGGIEGHMLAAAMASKAAGLILADTAIAGDVVLLSGTETFSLGDSYQANRQLTLLESETRRFVTQVAGTRCILPGSKVAPQAVDPGTKSVTAIPLAQPEKKFDFQVSDALGAFRTSSSFSPVSVTLGPQLFKNVLLAKPKAGVTWVIPGDLNQPTGGEELLKTFTGVRESLIPFADGKCDGTDAAIKKEAATLLARADGLAASKEGAPSLLDRAVVARSMLSSGSGTPDKVLKVLRVDVDRAGGTLVSSSNVFTTLGIPGVTIRGGLVVTYRLTDPVNGQRHSAGTIICRVPQKLLKRITSEAIDPKSVTCDKVA